MGILDAPGLTRTQADARYANKGSIPTRPDLPTPFYVAHRGGAAFAPEQSEDAYRISAALGVDILDGDVQDLGDGAFVAMHDSTVDATTNATGPVATYNAMSILNLNAAAKFPWPRTTAPALVSDVISRYAAQSTLSFECKDLTQGDAFMDLVEKRGAVDAVILTTNSTPFMQAAKARGFKVFYYWPFNGTGTNADGVGGNGLTIAEAVAAGVDYITVDWNRQRKSIPALVASGIPIAPYDIVTRADRDGALAMGCDGIVSDHWYYLKANRALATVTSWKDGMYGHGFLSNPRLPGNTASYTIVNGGLVIEATGGSVIVGELCPIVDPAYTLDVDLGWLTDPTGSGTPAIVFDFGVPDDTNQNTSMGGATGLNMTGWKAYLRWLGGMTLYKISARTDAATVTSGSATVADTSITTADAGRPITGAGIPEQTFVGTAANIVAGTSFKLSASSTAQVDVPATASGTSVTIGGILTAINATAVQTPALTVGGLARLKAKVTGSSVLLARTDAAGTAATLSAGLSAGVAITSIPVTALPAPLTSAQKLLLANGDVAVTSGTAAAGATAIPIASLTPTSAIASGTKASFAVQAFDTTNRGGYVQVGRQSGLTPRTTYKITKS